MIVSMQSNTADIVLVSSDSEPQPVTEKRTRKKGTIKARHEEAVSVLRSEQEGVVLSVKAACVEEVRSSVEEGVRACKASLESRFEEEKRRRRVGR
jgi:hypothetical protein